MKPVLLVLALAACGDTTPPSDAEPPPRPPDVVGFYEIRSVDGVPTPAPAPPVSDCDVVYTTSSEVAFGLDSTFMGRIIQRYECPESSFTSTARLEGTYSVRVNSSIILRGLGTENVDEAWAGPGSVDIVWRMDQNAPFDTLTFARQ